MAAQVRLALATVSQTMHLPASAHDLAHFRADQPLLVAVTEMHRSCDDRPAFLLLGVVVRRPRATRLQRVVHDEGVAGFGEPLPHAADRVSYLVRHPSALRSERNGDGSTRSM